MEFIALLIVIFVAVWIQNRLYKKMAFRDLEYECRLSKTEVFEGEELELIEVVTNNKWLPLPWLKAEISTSKHLEIAEKTATINETIRTVSSFFVYFLHISCVIQFHFPLLQFFQITFHDNAFLVIFGAKFDKIVASFSAILGFTKSFELFSIHNDPVIISCRLLWVLLH